MRNDVISVDHGRYPLVCQEISRGVLLGALTLVEDDLHLDAALMGIEQRFGDRRSG
jgi:hypothetical protein